MFKTVIFDLDGTLLDTSMDIQKVLNNTLIHFNLPRISLEKTVEYVGNGAKLLIERAIPQSAMDNFEQIYAHYAKNFAACDNELTCLYPGEEEVLLNLKKAGIKLALVTNKPQDATEGVYEKHLKRFDFDFVAGNSLSFPLKPDPALALYAAKSTGARAEECLFVGDGETDVQTAINAKMEHLSVLWGFRSKLQLKAAGAKNFAKSYSELEKFVLSHNQ
ncbi:MAG: HAD family hydrolase [Candidatus Coproplasma sp.]